MIIEQIWLLKLLLSHLLTDFILQPKRWVLQRNLKHFASDKLYLHGLITGLLAWLFIGLQYWHIALIITVTHTLIDGWKSYMKDAIVYFVIDQVLHLLIIVLCWYFTFLQWGNITASFAKFNTHEHFWILITGGVLLTTPVGILIGQMTKGWREKIINPTSLANAGKWIGIIERLMVYLLVLMGQFSAISLLIAAKGIIRFNEKDRPEVKTEYLVIGTLLSIGMAMGIGIAVNKLLS
jgi:hypothetical protein